MARKVSPDALSPLTPRERTIARTVIGTCLWLWAAKEYLWPHVPPFTGRRMALYKLSYEAFGPMGSAWFFAWLGTVFFLLAATGWPARGIGRYGL